MRTVSGALKSVLPILLIAGAMFAIGSVNAQEVDSSRFETPDRNVSRAFLGATARPVPKGEAYFAWQDFFFSFIGYGVTDRFTMSGGLTIMPFSPEQLYYMAPKLSFPVGQDRTLAVGVLAGSLVGRFKIGGLLYGPRPDG